MCVCVWGGGRIGVRRLHFTTYLPAFGSSREPSRGGKGGALARGRRRRRRRTDGGNRPHAAAAAACLEHAGRAWRRPRRSRARRWPRPRRAARLSRTPPWTSAGAEGGAGGGRPGRRLRQGRGHRSAFPGDKGWGLGFRACGRRAAPRPVFAPATASGRSPRRPPFYKALPGRSLRRRGPAPSHHCPPSIARPPSTPAPPHPDPIAPRPMLPSPPPCRIRLLVEFTETAWDPEGAEVAAHVSRGGAGAGRGQGRRQGGRGEKEGA
jgi:hypothetical protein